MKAINGHFDGKRQACLLQPSFAKRAIASVWDVFWGMMSSLIS
jgi:hypothetical protein